METLKFDKLIDDLEQYGPDPTETANQVIAILHELNTINAKLDEIAAWQEKHLEQHWLDGLEY